MIYAHKQLNMNGLDIINAGNFLSDRKLKKDIKDSEISAIDRIMQMQHRTFKWKKDELQEQIGYIAQELEEIDKNYVKHNITKDKEDNETDMCEIRLLPLISTATKAIQEQQMQMNELKKTVKEQGELIQELIERIEKLEGGKQ